ncbi:tRNA epoxyqueuosine(34) reductase QueG [Vagococcus intermedius]|uniref:tRNA epoxyqueuosine(34) reductase QueG n=1 Tax=Vagococcus intermedius TaxID=2991418 RepID=A0AAF0CTX7_9ENTE|nr:tRNA epoxyqueuosine(34) reductase QueG [Vagococcus intermedius]WEG72925.1 tRNA epoxyqueuosine(34) reductase QueG [Vagococcus intermedius]WEG75012.1 tRNA epoxyqueuosine(34) reductase QueG [Vagococcus intermedius]
MLQDLKHNVITLSKEIGIDKIGFTTAEPFSHLKESLQEQKAAGHTTGFEHPIIEERLEPALLFQQPRSIISIALAYPTRLSAKAESIKGERRGSFARASWGTDYHDILQDRMTKLMTGIKELANEETNLEFKPMVDTGELIDVAVAQRAGLGFIGKNGLLITEEFGSYVYLGEIITNIPFEPDTPKQPQCGDCRKCIDLCPTSALLGDGRMNGQICLSYQTQTKGMMPLEYRKKIRNVIYGCDICQQVCPFNKGVDTHHHQEMEADPESVTPLLTPLLTISNKEFKTKFGSLAGSWRGKKPLQRNAIIALANAKQKSAVPKLLALVENDPRPVIRGTAIWAISELSEFGNLEIVNFLEKQKTVEIDSEVLVEIDYALTHLTEPF